MQFDETLLKSYLPSVYDEVLETDELCKAENKLFEEALGHLDKLWKNSFIRTCDIDGVAYYERVLGIVAATGEDSNFTQEEYLAFRKTRIINRLSSIPSYTMPWLRARLTELLGDSWEPELDYAKQELIIKITDSNAVWTHEVAVTINQVKPASLVFISRPLQEFKILVSETVSKQVRTNNYTFGAWNLRNLPFSQFSDAEVAKLADSPSIQPLLLGKMATLTAETVKSVRVTGSGGKTHTISNFIIKKSQNEIVTIEYEVYASEGLGEIVKAELLDATGGVLASITVSVDNTFNVRLHHIIEIKEGLYAKTT